MKKRGRQAPKSNRSTPGNTPKEVGLSEWDPSSPRLSKADLRFATVRLGDFTPDSGDMFDENPVSRAIRILEVCARWRQLPPEWAVKRWSENVGGKPGKRKRQLVVDWIRAITVENCSGSRYRRGEQYNKFSRAAKVLAETDARLFCGLPVAVGEDAIRRSHRDVARFKRHPYWYLGFKAYLYRHLPFLMLALEQKDTPKVLHVS